MNVSQAGLDLIKQFEGFSAKVYKDVAGFPTVGYGHRLRPGESFPEGITEDQAQELLAKDVSTAESAVNRYATYPISQNQFDSLVSFAYNVGTGAFSRSTLLRMLNAGKTSEAADQLLRWNKSGGKVVDGLTRRREAERALFLCPNCA